MNNNMASCEVFESFSGLGLSTRGKTSCRLENFRVLADGSLEKREGIRQLASLPEPVRGVYSFFDGDEEVILAVCGNCLYQISRDGEILSSPCFSTSEGEVGSFVHGGRLYFLDGTEAYRYEGKGCAIRVHGYTPLYGKNWCTYRTDDHFLNEPINCFSPHIRIHFLVVSSTKLLSIGFCVESVDWVMANGVMIDPSKYSLTEAKNHVSFTESIYTSEMEISVTISESLYRDADFCSCRSAAVYEGFANSRAFFYGGKKNGQFFVSKRLDPKEAERDQALFSDSCGLYFPKGESLSVGSGQPITAVHRMLDRMLIFFPSSLWASEPLNEVEGDGILFSPICGHLGCSSSQAVVMTGASSPISVAHSGVYLWEIDPDLLSECVVRCISKEMLPVLEGRFFANAGICHHRKRGELWFYDADGGDGRILLYSLDRKTWYCYSGVLADRLFAFDGGVGFVKGDKLCIFDEDLCTDRFFDGEEKISALFESGWLDFDGAGTDKRLEALVLTADLSVGELSASLFDGKLLGEEKIFEADAVASGIYERRVPTGRFRAAKLRLCACGPMRERIYRVELLAQKGKK